MDLLKGKVKSLEKYLYYYKKTSRDLKKQIRVMETSHLFTKEPGANFVMEAGMRISSSEDPVQANGVLNDSLEQEM